MNDALYMNRCFELAQKGAGQVSPNPMVGAVLVYEGRIIGEGYHEHFGGAHAEVNCLRSVKPEDAALVAKSALYVSLEPCNHFGKTPPCTSLILQQRIPEVVIGCTDPFEKVNGSGVAHLVNHGVKVRTGILDKEARALNRRFFCFHQQQRPYIILKWAQTADGKISGKDNQPLAISHPLTNRLAHRWRSEESSIMIGTGTLMSDNPSLTTRLWPGKNPVRVIIDKHLKAAQSLRVFDESAETLIFNLQLSQQSGKNVFIKIKQENNLLQELLQSLQQRSILSMLVEGGTTTLQHFIQQGLWDEARVITNQKMLTGEGREAPVLQGHQLETSTIISSDRIDYFTNKGSIKI